MNVVPQSGQTVQVRGRPAVIETVSESKNAQSVKTHLVHVKYLDEHPYPREDTLVWEIEVDKRIRDTAGWPDVDEHAPDPSARYQAYLDAVRWTSLQSMEGQIVTQDDVPLVSPWSAAVQVEDYQLVPLLKALSMPRVSLLLADDVGLGKTIQAGLIATELAVRRGIRRMLIVCPASLQRQWQEEMRDKFHLQFVVLDGAAVQKVQLEHGSDVNPWTVHHRVITSMDFLKQELMLDKFETSAERIRGEVGEGRHPWDLLIVDEAHNVSPKGFGDASQRTQMMRRLTFLFEHRLFLTATPHNGYAESFTGLLELLDPYRFVQKEELDADDRRHRDAIMVRRLKREIDEATSTQRFPKRTLHGIPVQYTPKEQALFAALRTYRDEAHKFFEAGSKQRQNLARFLFSLFMKRLLSSPYAFARTWWTHVEHNQDANETDVATAAKRAEEETGDDQEQDARERLAAAQAGNWLFREAPKLRDPAAGVSRALNALGWTEEATRTGALAGVNIPDGKWDALLKHLSQGARSAQGDLPAIIGSPNKPTDERLLLFTEYRDTQRLILARLEAAGYKGYAVRALYGGMSTTERDEIKSLFNNPKSGLRILVATDAASEGLNLQKTCRNVAHYEIPWNPMRLEQRNGRVDRHGQPHELVYVFHYNSQEDEDDKFLETVIQKVNQAREDLGNVEAVIDAAVRSKLVLGRSQARLAGWTEAVDARRVKPAFLQDLPPPREEEFLTAHRRFERASRSYGFSKDRIRNLLTQFLTRQAGCRIEQRGETWEIVGAQGRLKKLVRRHLGDEAGNLPLLVFDPDAYLEDMGNNRRVYRPRHGTQLVRIGHPVFQAALSHYRRILWNPDDSDVQRWSLQNIRGREAYLAFDHLVTVRNKLQEVVHARIDTQWYHVTPRGLAPLSEAYEPEIVQDARKADIERWQPKLRESLILSKKTIEERTSALRASEQQVWTKKLADARAVAKVQQVEAFDRLIEDLRRLGVSEQKQRLERLLADEREKLKQRTLDLAIDEERKQRIAELEDQLRPENLNVWARNQQTQAERLGRERDRFVQHVLPLRYSLGIPLDVVEVGIRAYIPEAGL